MNDKLGRFVLFPLSLFLLPGLAAAADAETKTDLFRKQWSDIQFAEYERFRPSRGAKWFEMDMGKYGELYALPPGMGSEFPVLGEWQGQEIYLKAILLDLDKPYAKVDANGTITLLMPDLAPRMPEMPAAWPFRDDKGALADAPPGAVLQGPRPAEYRPPIAPLGSLLWMYETPNRILRAMPGNPPPLDNVLWLIRKSDGSLSLEYSGPRQTGLFATIARDGAIRFSQVAQTSLDMEQLPLEWPHLNDKCEPDLRVWSTGLTFDLVEVAKLQHSPVWKGYATPEEWEKLSEDDQRELSFIYRCRGIPLNYRKTDQSKGR